MGIRIKWYLNVMGSSGSDKVSLTFGNGFCVFFQDHTLSLGYDSSYN